MPFDPGMRLEPHLARAVDVEIGDIWPAQCVFVRREEGQATDALAVFSTIAPERLLAPEIALYHGLALFAAGREADAAKAFELAQKRRLFPEEALLLPPAFRGTVGKQ